MRAPATNHQGSRRGAILIWLVLSLGVVIVIVALGVDSGRMLEERRRLQAVADTAALVGAADMYARYLDNQGSDPSGTAATAARQAAADNGCPNQGATSVTVNIPPLEGPFAGKPEYIEVIVTSQLGGTFSRAFTSGTLGIKARAVALGRPLPLGVMVLQSSGPGTFAISGSATATVQNASILVNSGDSAAVTVSGSARGSADGFQIVGGVQGGGLVGRVETGTEPAPDPLKTIPSPKLADYPLRSSTLVEVGSNETATLQPGIYRGGILLSGNAQVTMLPGIYILDGGGFSVTGGANLTADRVMFYNTGATSASSVSIGGTGNVSITAPTEGPYQGISVFQDRNLSQTVSITGNGNYQIGGTVYAIGAAVHIDGNGSISTNSLGGGYVCSSLQISGSGSFNVDPGSNRPKVPEVRLVE